MLHAVRERHTGRVDDHAADRRAERKRRPGLIVTLALIEFHEVVRNQRNRIERKRVRERLRASCRVRLDAVAERVKADGGEHLLRHRLHELRVHDRCFRDDGRRAERLLVSRLRVCENREAVALRACAAGRRNQNERKRLRARLPAEDIIRDAALIFSHERDRLRAVHDTASAESDNYGSSDLLRKLRALHRRRRQRIRCSFVEQLCLHAFLLK